MMEGQTETALAKGVMLSSFFCCWWMMMVVFRL